MWRAINALVPPPAAAARAIARAPPEATIAKCRSGYGNRGEYAGNHCQSAGGAIAGDIGLPRHARNVGKFLGCHIDTAKLFTHSVGAGHQIGRRVLTVVKAAARRTMLSTSG
jgi:hypothetical protein